MSKNSNRKRYTQLVEWLSSFKKTSKTTNSKNILRLEYYSSKGN